MLLCRLFDGTGCDIFDDEIERLSPSRRSGRVNGQQGSDCVQSDFATHRALGDVEKPEYRKRFTSSWQKWDIRFDGDVIGFPAFAQELEIPGYPLGSNTRDVDPMFTGEGRKAGDFGLSEHSPARNSSIPMDIQHPSGQRTNAEGENVGALQRPPGSTTSNRFEGPKFEPTLGNFDCQTFMGV